MSVLLIPGAVSEKTFSALRASVWSRNKGGRVPRAPPLDSPLIFTEKESVRNLYDFFFTTDIDECSAETNPCDENADCANIDGSFSCTCKEGFTGAGKTCQGVFF